MKLDILLASSCNILSNHQPPMIPSYLHSMFSFKESMIWLGLLEFKSQRVSTKTSGRTTLNGEGLQHQDGHSHIMAGTIPNCRSYDPCFSYELETIISEGIDDMYVKNNDRYYYITLMNENYIHPKRPKNATPENIMKGAYCYFKPKQPDFRILASGLTLNLHLRQRVN